MKRSLTLLAILALALAASGCASAPSITSGEIVDKDRRVDDSLDCGIALDGSGEYTCSKLNSGMLEKDEMIYELVVSGCAPYNRDGVRQENCQRKTVTVGEGLYERAEIGDTYDLETGRLADPTPR